MDDPADALLALSNTAAAIAEVNEVLIDEDDRSSSLSELEDAPDNIEIDEEADQDEEMDSDESDEEQEGNDQVLPDASIVIEGDGDSEAETERLEESPDKPKKTKTFQISPSKLAQTMNASDDVRPEIEELTGSEASSPIDDLSDVEGLDEPENPLNLLSQAATVTAKRKRLSDVMDITSDERPRKRRTQSLSDVEDEESEPESDAEAEVGKIEVPTRESTLEPDDPEDKEDEIDAPNDVHVGVGADGEQEQAEASDDSKSKKPEQYTRSKSRRGKDAAEEQEEEDNEVDATDDEADQDDIDVNAKTEEEQAKRSAAMDALTSLEKHFATLRDKLYDEKISLLNHELVQLTADQPTHPELLKQNECVNKHRDEKQDVEQRLLVFKVGALKIKSVAERSILHSSYFQTIRDLRERRMETLSEQFYRIQRERFKSSQQTPTYTIPFPATKVAQVTQQTAYNKEVSILSGLAKYVGFPAAPDLKSTPTSDLDIDLQKMGINSTAIRIRTAASSRHPNLTSYPTTGATSVLSTSAAAATASSEQQFIESTPWANPNHPIHRLGRQTANKSPFAADHQYSATTTPAHQQPRNNYTPQPVGSASTIIENPSAQPTPGTDLQSSALKQEPGTHPQTNSISATNMNGEIGLSISPTETRRTINNMLQAGSAAAQALTRDGDGTYLSISAGVNSSPLLARASLLSSLNRTASASPFRLDAITGSGGGGGGGMGRFGFR